MKNVLNISLKECFRAVIGRYVYYEVIHDLKIIQVSLISHILINARQIKYINQRECVLLKHVYYSSMCITQTKTNRTCVRKKTSIVCKLVPLYSNAHFIILILKIKYTYRARYALKLLNSLVRSDFSSYPFYL